VQDFFLIETTRWLLLDKPHYVVAILLGVIVYYNMRMRILVQPPVLIKQPRMKADDYEREKK